MSRGVEFPSEGVTRGLLFLPEAQTQEPLVVIMDHGTSATVRMVTDKHAEAFCAPVWQSYYMITVTLEGAGASPGRRSIPGFSAEATAMR